MFLIQLLAVVACCMLTPGTLLFL